MPALMCKFIHIQRLLDSNSGLIIYIFKMTDGVAIKVAIYVHVVMMNVSRVGDVTEIIIFFLNL